MDFYPSISSQLLTNAINFAAEHTNISNQTIDTVMHARKSLLFNGKDTWIKSSGSLFDVTMGSFDGAEVCELVGIYLLSEMKEEFKNLQVGLYRDDGLGLVRNMTSRQQSNMKKAITRFFHKHGLAITIESNLTQVNFLDTTLNLGTEKYWPYRKDNSPPLYIHKDSNHPPAIIKELPKMIESRITSLSCNEEEFNKAKDIYNTGLRNSGFDSNIQFNNTGTNRSPRSRKRKVIWFNPPFNRAVKTNIGRAFLSLLDKHFPPHHKFARLFNRNSVKLSYSCTPNMGSIIANHNKKILNSDTSAQSADSNARNCNCSRRSPPCPLNGNCLVKCVVYKATVSTDQSTLDYIGSTETTFKERYRTHMSSFSLEHLSSSTSLSKYISDLNRREIAYSLNWEILKKPSPYRCGTRRCDLCLTEKLLILQAGPTSVLNKHSEIMQKCRHANKFKLVKVP